MADDKPLAISAPEPRTLDLIFTPEARRALEAGYEIVEADPQAIGAQTCRDGTYATVLVVRPDLAGSPAEGRSVRWAAETLLSRRSR